MTATNTILLLH